MKQYYLKARTQKFCQGKCFSSGGNQKGYIVTDFEISRLNYEMDDITFTSLEGRMQPREIIAKRRHGREKAES